MVYVAKKWTRERIELVRKYLHKGFTDYVIADMMTKKHDVKFTQKQILGVRARQRIQKPNKKSAEVKNKKIDNTDYYKRMAEISRKAIMDNRQQTARIRKFNLEEGKLYTIKTDNTGSNNKRGIKVYRDLKFLYMTDYVLFFKDKHGITKSFIRDNNSVKVKKMEI